ncbi:hypothetical protein [Leisingera sp. F5]|uniref:hypothetical protein n=1 Tax=Leisingera sp. F5 TaxID=1813816 RepID=UPI000AB4A5EF|nr:hypothetical protein [Leisingera sp. F5]
MKPLQTAAAGIFAAGMGASAVLFAMSTDEAEDGCTKLAAYSFTQAEVTRRLSSPGTAAFPADPPAPMHVSEDVIIATKGECLFGVSAWVDAQNALGAIRRTNFSADVEYQTGTGRWALRDIHLAPH